GNRGDNTIEGSLNQPNTLDGRQGDDTLIGGNAGDTYAFSSGYDLDTIIERPDQAGVIDRIVFGASVVRDDVVFRRNSDDLVIDLGNGRDVITVVGGLANTRVETFEFADGSSLTLEQVIDRMLTGSAADERIDGLDGRNDTISGAKGSDALAGGLGNDAYTFGVGDGSDSVQDTGGIDRVVFGATITHDNVRFENFDGDLLITLATKGDRLVVLGGYATSPVETFVFADGTSLNIADVRARIFVEQSHTSQDLIDMREVGRAALLEPGTGNDHILLANDAHVLIRAGDGIDRVEMPSGVTRATVQFADALSTQVVVRLAALDSNDLILSLPLSGDQIVLVGARTSGLVPSLQFADGRTWDAATVFAKLVLDQASDDNDIVLGSVSGDTIAGGLGDDQTEGGAGDDTYLFARGDGHDVIIDTVGTDALKITGYRASEMRVTRPAADRNELILKFADADDEVSLRFGDG
ncbi:MAG: calcium-binding protein, partial [Hyphomicrobiaceae bacterium]